MKKEFYLVHVEFAFAYIRTCIIRNGIGLVPYSIVLVEVHVVKSLVPSNVKGHGKVSYQKPQLKSHGVYHV